MNAPSEIYPILAVIVGALAMASAIGFFLRRRVHDSKGAAFVQNLNARILSWWAMVAITSSCCLAGRSVLVVFFAAISFFALREILTLVSARSADRLALLSTFLLVLPLQYVLIWMHWYGLFVIFIPVYAFVGLPILAALTSDTRDFLVRIAEIQWAVMIAVYCISYVPALETLHPSTSAQHSVLLIGFLLIVTQSSDVLQYVFGKLFGRHPVAPQLSPSKTIEGTIGGIASAMLIGALLWRITPFNRGQAMLMALLIALTGFVGGLVMSAIKRDRGVKDWGRLIGGHGGMLDRLDSVCFSAPIFFHITRYFFS